MIFFCVTEKRNLYKNTNPGVCVSRDNGVLRCKDKHNK